MQKTSLTEEALTFLSDPTHLTAVVGSCVENKPHTATVYYAIDDDFNIYFLTATNTKKYDNLLINNEASIVIGFGPDYTTFQGNGVVALLEKGSEEENFAISFLKSRLSKTNDTWPVFQLSESDDESIAVFKIELTELYLLNLERDSGLTTTPDEPKKVL